MIPRFARRLAASFAAVLAFATPATATIFTTDFTDMWWNSAEDGWGVNIVQQGDVIFATWFVYGPDGLPRWYVASGMQPQASSPGSTTNIFSGSLYRTNGPWFGGPFTPAVTNQTVGTATITFSAPGSASLTYNVDTTVVTKPLTRYTFRNNNPVGRFFPAGLTVTRSACTGGASNGAIYFAGLVGVTVSGSQVRYQLDFNDNNGVTICVFNGTWVQEGRLGAVNSGTWGCTPQGASQPINNGTFTLSRVDVQIDGFTSQFTGSDNFCQYSGRFGGVRDVVN